MTRLENKFDGGTNGVTITTGNSGGASGNAFEEIFIPSGATIIYDSANAYAGGMAAAIDPATSTGPYLAYTTSVGTVTTQYGRVYVKFPSFPTSNMVLVAFRDTTTALNRGRISVLTDGRLRLVDSAGATVATSSGAPGTLVAGSYARLEYKFVGDPTAGILEVKLFLTPDSLTPSSTLTATGINTAGSIDRLRIGSSVAVATDVPAYYLDEVVWDTAGYPGPIGASATVSHSTSAIIKKTTTRTHDADAIVPSSTATYDWMEGFETQDASIGILGASTDQMWTSGIEGGTISFVAGRWGGSALRIVENGATNRRHDLPASTMRVLGLEIRLDAPPAANSNILLVNDPAGTNLIQIRVDTAGLIGARFGITGSYTDGPQVADGLWKIISLRLNTSGTTWTLDWSVENAPQTQVSLAGQAAGTTSQRLLLGTGTPAQNATIEYDDLVASTNSTHHPMLHHRVHALNPTADGAHNLGSSNPIVNESGTGTMWSRVDDWAGSGANPEDEIFGPVTGVAAVRAATAPLAVTRPGTVNVECYPTDTTAQIRTKIAGATGVVWFNKGTYNLRGTGDANDCALRLNASNNGVTLVFESAAGYTRTASDSAIIDGGATEMSAFIWTGSVATHNITIRGGCFQNIGYSSGNQYDWGSAVRLDGYSHTIEDAIAQNNQVQGFQIGDDQADTGLNTMRRLYAYNNGLSGLSAYAGYAANSTVPWLIEKCRVNHNCIRSLLATNDAHYVAPGNTHANTKFFINNATFDSNWIHDGVSFGLWNDWRHFNTTVTNNVIENNQGAGVFWESTNGNNRFYHNYFKDNGNNVNAYGGSSAGFFPYGAGNILLTGPDSTRAVTGSNDPVYGYPIIDIAYNVLDSYGSGDSGYQYPAGEYPFLPPHPWAVLVASYQSGGADTGYYGHKGVKVHHNQIWFRGTGNGMGGYDDTPPAALWAESTNEWHDNEYHVQSLTASNWWWGPHTSPPGKPFTWAQWQAAGKDSGSTRVLI